MFTSAARLIRAGIATAIAFSPFNADAYSWERPHSNSTNSGLFDAPTIPATTPLKVVQNIGTFAPGAGPVIGPDGTLYLGNEQGTVMTFHPDGTPGWTYQIPGQSIVASPVLDSSGSLYVIGIKRFTDHRVNPPEQRMNAILHKLSPAGALVQQSPLPVVYGASGTTAAPNIWKSGNAEVIIIPIAYEAPLHGGQETHLLAYSPSGLLMADTKIGFSTGTVTGGSGMSDAKVYSCLIPPFIHCIFPLGFSSPAGQQHAPVPQPLPTVATYSNPGGGTPLIVVADGFENLVAYTFSGANFFDEIFRVHDETDVSAMVATPTVLVDGHTIFEAPDGIRFAGPNANPLSTIKDMHTLAAPTQLRSGKVVFFNTNGEIVVLNGDKIEKKIPTEDFSVASPAASHTHFYVSLENTFLTYNADTLEEAGRIAWSGGGLSSPVIGPQGNVYAIAANQLYVFPGPGQTKTANAGAGGTAGTSDLPTTTTPTSTDPAGDQPTQSSRQAYKPPLTENGNRLFACQDPDGEDCGKGDAKEVANAFCEKQGYSSVDEIDVDTKKTKAETLDGEFCTKKKCKVFKKIVCAM